MGKMCKQWHIKGRKEKGDDNSDIEDETNLAKVNNKTKDKEKGGGKGKGGKGGKGVKGGKGGKDGKGGKGGKGKKKETCTCNFCRKKWHIKIKCWKMDPTQMPAHI